MRVAPPDEAPTRRARARSSVIAGGLTRSRARYATPTGSPASGQGGPQRGPAQPRPGRHAVSRPGNACRAATPRGGQPARDGQDNGNQNNGPARRPAQPGRAGAEVEKMAAQLAERTADLQRLQAEYANYRKRVERDRLAVREQALANVLTELLPVLDDIGRAREHGELTGGFKSVAESLEAATVKLGLNSYGENGDPFDPTLHEALMHSYSAGRDRADVRPDPAARLQGRRADPAPGPGCGRRARRARRQTNGRPPRATAAGDCSSDSPADTSACRRLRSRRGEAR